MPVYPRQNNRITAMRLTLYTDYSLRLLMYLAVNEDGLATIQEISESYDISRNHLMKVAAELGRMGFIETVRGHGGGLRLAKKPGDIRLGALVRSTEDDGRHVECFQASANTCRITPACKLRHALKEALEAYYEVLDRLTLADLVTRPGALRKLLALSTT
jgi:Rrf2 family nitric oxide-sensitive transcriptional repressor